MAEPSALARSSACSPPPILTVARPTGSPLSELKALDAEADRRMKGSD